MKLGTEGSVAVVTTLGGVLDDRHVHVLVSGTARGTAKAGLGLASSLIVLLVSAMSCGHPGYTIDDFPVMLRDADSFRATTTRATSTEHVTAVCDKSVSAGSSPHANVLWNVRGISSDQVADLLSDLRSNARRLGYRQVPLPPRVDAADGETTAYRKNQEDLHLFISYDNVRGGNERSYQTVSVSIEPENVCT